MPHRKKALIREYASGDFESVYSLILSIIETEFDSTNSKLYLDDISDIQHNYIGDGDAFFIAEKSDKIVGTIALKRDDEEVALIRRFFVHPDHRGSGIGKALLDTAFQFCRDRKYKKVEFMGNTRMERAKEIFKKLGFKEETDLMLPGVEIFKLTHSVSSLRIGA